MESRLGTSRPRQFQVFSEGDLPFSYSELNDFRSWVDDWQKVCKLKKEIANLEKERKRLEDLPPSRQIFEDKVRVSFEKVQDERLHWIEKFLCENLLNEDPMNKYAERINSMHAVQRYVPGITWGEIISALDRMSQLFTDPKDEKTREKRLLLLERETAGKAIDIQKLSPPVYCKMKNGKIIADKRDLCFRFWRRTQKLCNEGVNLFGYRIEECPQNERWAWHMLEIDKLIDPYGDFYGAHRPKNSKDGPVQ